MTTVFKNYTSIIPETLHCTIMCFYIVKYNTCNEGQYDISICKLKVFNRSYVADAVRKYNLFNVKAKKTSSINIFRNFLFKNISKPHPYFAFGKRYIKIIHTKSIHNCLLNCDLFRCIIIYNLPCSCGKEKNACHFFVVCIKYSNFRKILFN